MSQQLMMFSLVYAWTNSWENTWDAGDFRRRRAHYDVIIMMWTVHLFRDM